MKLVVGLDLSLTGSAIAVIDRATCDLYRPPRTLRNKLTDMTRLAYLRTEIISEIYSLRETAQVDPVFIEGYGFSFRGMDFTLAELGGVIRLSLLECLSLGYYNVPPTSLKLFVTGKGVAPKNIMLEQVYRKYNLGSEVLKDDNQVDAYALARFGAEYMNWTEGKADLPKKIVESFKKIKGCESIDCVEAYLK